MTPQTFAQTTAMMATLPMQMTMAYSRAFARRMPQVMQEALNSYAQEAGHMADETARTTREIAERTTDSLKAIGETGTGTAQDLTRKAADTVEQGQKSAERAADAATRKATDKDDDKGDDDASKGRARGKSAQK